MAAKQFYGIKYPFENSSGSNRFVDLNESIKEKVESDIMHIIFTPKGQRYRMPEFGTELIKYVFEPNDSETWDKILEEINMQVGKYVPYAEIDDVEILQDEENPNSIFATIKYKLKNGNETENNEVTVKLV